MTKPLDSLMVSLACIVCCSPLFLAGCASIAPPSEQQSSTRYEGDVYDSAPSASWSMSTPPLIEVELPESPEPPRAIDLTVAPDDVFQRIRHGFAMPELRNDLVQYHEQWYLEHPEYLRRMVERSRYYLYHIVEELEKRGLPTELALLPMVESAYDPMAYSRAKASGLWQFIPSTGRRYNLDQDWWKDERRDVVASTAAALEYLQLIYELHGDWHLALASYNWGEGAVGRAIAKNEAQGLPTDYPSLTLPNETRNYVPKLQALKNIFRDPSLTAGLDLPKVPNRPFFTTYTTDSHIDIQVAARLAEMPVKEFVALNPAHKRPVIKPDTPLVIPAEKLETFVSNLENHDDENKPLSAWRVYRLRPGDKLEKIAPRFGTTVARLKAVNGIGGKARLSPGQTLLVPGTDKGKTDANSNVNPGSGPVDAAGVHVVRAGESLSLIATRHGLSVAEIKKINGLKNNRIAIGERLQLTAGRKTASAEAAGIRKAERDSPPGAPKVTHYTVRRGDTIYSIARQFKVAEKDLMRRNSVTPRSLKAGATLTIPLAENS
jgi:membrane-bound lytic murein transglycosylase D